MSFFIVFAGKGGTGKSSLAAITLRYLIEKNLGPLIAIDADPNFCLPELLGVLSFETLAEVRENALNRKPEGMSLDEWLQIEVNRIIFESRGFDLLVMGRPEGSGCYCAVNNVLKRVINDIAEHYKYIIIDNEAGMEHISRGLLNKADLLFIIATPAQSSLGAAIRIDKLTRDIGIKPKKKILIINQSSENKITNENLKNLFYRVDVVGFDNNLKKMSEKGDSIFTLPEDTQVIKEFYKILEVEIER